MKSGIVVLSMCYAAALWSAEKQDVSKEGQGYPERDVKVRVAVLSAKDQRDSAAWWKALFGVPSQGKIEIMEELLDANPNILKVKKKFNLTGMSEPREYWPLEAVAYWEAYQNYIQQKASVWPNFFKKMVALDQDNQRRVDSLLWGIHWYSADVVREFLHAETTVMHAPQLFVKYVDRCRELTQESAEHDKKKDKYDELVKKQKSFLDQWDIDHAAIKESIKEKEHELKKKSFLTELLIQIKKAKEEFDGEESNSHWDEQRKKLDKRQDNMRVIVALLLREKADVSGVAQMRNRPHADVNSCLPCTLIFNRIDDEREAQQRLPAPSAPLALYPQLKSSVSNEDAYGKMPE